MSDKPSILSSTMPALLRVFRRPESSKRRFLRGLAFGLGCVAAMSNLGAAEPVSDKQGSNTVQVLAPLAMSGPLGPTAKDYLAGAEAHFRAFNGTAAARGRAISVTVVDNPSTEQAQDVLSRAFRKYPAAIAVFMPMQTITALELINGEQIAVIAPPSGSFEEHDPNLTPNSFHIKGSWDNEYQKIAEHLASQGINKVAFVYDETVGTRESNSFPLITQIFIRNGISLKPMVLKQGARDIGPMMGEIHSYEPQAVVLGLVGEDMLKFLDAYKARSASWPLYTTSQGNHRSVRQALKQMNASIGITQVLPPFWDRTVPVVREYQDAMRMLDYTEFSYHSLEGYVAARVLTEAVRRAPSPVTRQGVMAALESMSRMDLAGFVVRFSPGKHDGAAYIDLTLLRRDGQYIR